MFPQECWKQTSSHTTLPISSHLDNTIFTKLYRRKDQFRWGNLTQWDLPGRKFFFLVLESVDARTTQISSREVAEKSDVVFCVQSLPADWRSDGRNEFFAWCHHNYIRQIELLSSRPLHTQSWQLSDSSVEERDYLGILLLLAQFLKIFSVGGG